MPVVTLDFDGHWRAKVTGSVIPDWFLYCQAHELGGFQTGSQINIKLTLHDEPLASKVADGSVVRVSWHSTRSPLHEAAGKNCVPAIRRWISSAMAVDIRDQHKRTPLQLAVERASIKAIRELLKCGADANAQDDDQDTPLHHTAGVAWLSSIEKIIQILIVNGADIKAQNRSGDTPLHVAVATRSLEAVRVLLACGAAVFTPNRDGITPLALARTSHIGLDALDRMHMIEAAAVRQAELQLSEPGTGIILRRRLGA